MLYNESVEVLSGWSFEELEERKENCIKYGFQEDLLQVEKAIKVKINECISLYPVLDELTEVDDYTKAKISLLLKEMNENSATPIYDELNIFGENIVKFLINNDVVKPMAAIKNNHCNGYSKYNYLAEEVVNKYSKLRADLCYKYYELRVKPSC